jgi:hypothetical protein
MGFLIPSIGNEQFNGTGSNIQYAVKNSFGTIASDRYKYLFAEMIIAAIQRRRLCDDGFIQHQIVSPYNSIEDEEIDFQATCWRKSMSQEPSQDPKAALENRPSIWACVRSEANNRSFCISVAVDNNAFYASNLTVEQASNIL